MNRQNFEKFLNQKVILTFFDNKELTGTLKQGMGLGNNNFDTTQKKWYYIEGTNLNFKLSHIKKIKKI